VQALIYWSVASFLRLVTRLFFRTIEVVGRPHDLRRQPPELARRSGDDPVDRAAQGQPRRA
jgi:hypothetical protein